MSSSIFDSDSSDLSSWLKKDRLEKKIEDPLPHRETSAPDSLQSVIARKPEKTLPVPAPNSALLEPFETLLQQIASDQLKRPEDLLKLNPSRRESLGRFLSELARMPEPSDPQEALRQFVRPDRNETEHEAIKQLFRQIALVQIAKALLLKSWRSHTGTPLSKTDLKDLTASLERDIRPFINLQTSTCQLVQANFYSWSKLSPETQEKLWLLLATITDLSGVKEWLFKRARKLSAETMGERQRYGNTFYRNLWKSIERHKLFQPRGEQLIGFSPTLRDGSLFEHSPESIEWIGFEPLSFELLFCEIRYLWKQPKNPPLWVKGSGLEMSMEQQGSLLVTHCGKQNSLKQMDAISCAEVALIAEETLIRTQGKGIAAQLLRNLVDEHSILKKIKQPQTTRGMYQACQTLEKLRQGGTLIWAREELLSEASGKPALQFLLNQARILMIADLSALVGETDRIGNEIPKVLYILKKESRLEERKSHRPLLIKAYGSIENADHVELLFDRLMSLAARPDQTFPPEPFHLQTRISPMDQREWEQHWFNPNDDELVDQIEDLKRNSSPLGQFATVRTLHPAMQADFDSSESSLFHSGQSRANDGFFVWVESSRNGNELYTAPREKLPHYLRNNHSLYWIVPLRPDWNHPLQTLIRSSLTRGWFDYSVERKKGAWLMKESDLKSIPVPKHIGDALLSMTSNAITGTEYENRILSQIATEPDAALRSIEEQPHLKAPAFIFASQALAQLEEHQGTLFNLISPDEQIKFPDFFNAVLTEEDLLPIHQHPMIKFTPTLTPHQAVHSINPMKYPAPGILLATAKGLTQVIHIQDTFLRERCMEMLESLQREIAEPSWGEILRRIRLPKNPEQAQAMATQVLKAFGSEKMRRKELNHLIGVCLIAHKDQAERVGLLQ